MRDQHGTPPNKALERTGGEASRFFRAPVAAGRSARRWLVVPLAVGGSGGEGEA